MNMVKKWVVLDQYGQQLFEFFDREDALTHVDWSAGNTITYKTVKEKVNYVKTN